MLAGQLSGERSAVRSLEETLNQKRRTEWSSESSIKQLQVEKSQMQRKVSLHPHCQCSRTSLYLNSLDRCCFHTDMLLRFFCYTIYLLLLAFSSISKTAFKNEVENIIKYYIYIHDSTQINTFGKKMYRSLSVQVSDDCFPASQISELEGQLEDEVRESKRLRTQAAELEAELERRKRELTDERFERERTSQELRRVQRFHNVSRALDALDSGSPAPTQGTGPPRVALTPSPPHPPSQRRSGSESPQPGPAQQEEQGGAARAPSVPLHSSSSDTGLERSQAVSSSSDSHHEPWRLAFGSRGRVRQPPSASQESVSHAPSSHRVSTSPLREAPTPSAAASTLPSHSRAEASPLSSSGTHPIRKGPSFSQITTSSPCSPCPGTTTTAPSSLGPSPASSQAPLLSVRPKDMGQQQASSHTDPDSSP